MSFFSKFPLLYSNLSKFSIFSLDCRCQMHFVFRRPEGTLFSNLTLWTSKLTNSENEETRLQAKERSRHGAVRAPQTERLERVLSRRDSSSGLCMTKHCLCKTRHRIVGTECSDGGTTAFSAGCFLQRVTRSTCAPLETPREKQPSGRADMVSLG